MSSDKLIVLFPGVNYSVEMPLFYYAQFTYEMRGYKVLHISYKTNISADFTYEEYLATIKQMVYKQLLNQNLDNYKEIIFISKSIGTVLAGWIASERNLEVKHIFLTPIYDTLQYIGGQNIVAVIAGREDNKLDKEILMEHCRKENIYLHQFDHVGHRLESKVNMELNLNILRNVIEIYNLV